MTTHLPADIEMSFPYRLLVDRLGHINAAYVFMRLWSDLAFQTRIHGMSGVYQGQYIERFKGTINKAHAEAWDALLTSTVLAKHGKGGDYMCRLFRDYNPELDVSYIPDTSKWMRDWMNYREEMLKNAGKIIDRIPQAAWYLKVGEVISEDTMRRATVLICSLDVILHRKHRLPEQFGIGLVQTACAIVDTWGDDKISCVLKRLMSLSRPMLNPALPPTTEEAVERWDDLVAQIYPDEGFTHWIKRVEALPDNEDGKTTQIARVNTITSELAEEMARVSS